MALSRQRATSLGEAVQRRVLGWDVYRRAPVIVLYAGKDNEVATDLILADALRCAKRVYYPRLTPDRTRLDVVRVSDRSELRPGAFRIFEPIGEEIANLRELDAALFLVPGIAFCIGGYRLGHGGGHYDRMFAEAPAGVISAGLSYSFQLLDRLPVFSHDRRLDFIVTESAIHPTDVHAPASGRSQAEQGGTARWTC